MDMTGRAPRPARRPRRATLAPSSAFLLQLLLNRDPASGVWLAANRRRLPLELQVALDEDLDELRVTAEEFRAFFAPSDVGHAAAVGSDMPRRLAHGEITTAEAAGELGVSSRQVLRWVADGQLVGRQVNPRSTLVTRASVRALRELRSAA